MKVSENYYDEVFQFKGQFDIPSCCGLKIKQKDGRTVVCVTELYQDNPGTSVTYAGKELLIQICEAKNLDIEKVVYLQCNPDTNSKLSFYDEEYFEVTFQNGDMPQYRQVTSNEIKELL
ncbi:MAG: hypothetical protein LBR17_06560 [Bacteroidales bacterium]|jgi:hypothetical protein|nr:hypothetical protein [Bacteroidales bacterium]